MGQVARRGEGEFAYRVLAGKPEGNRQLARFRCKWDNNFKVDLQEEDGTRTGLIWLRIGTSAGQL